MTKAEKKSYKKISRIFRKEEIYSPIHVNEEPLGEYAKHNKPSKESEEKIVDLDKSIKGGCFTVDGQLVNANRDFIDKAGNLTDGRLPEKPSIKIRFLEKGYLVSKPHRNLKGYLEFTKKLINPKPSTIKDINEKANKILKDLETEHFSNFEQRELELNSRLDRMIQETLKSQVNSGRHKGSKNKNLKINSSELEKFINRFWQSEGKRPSQSDVIERFPKWSERTLRDFIGKNYQKRWIDFCKSVIEK